MKKLYNIPTKSNSNLKITLEHAVVGILEIDQSERDKIEADIRNEMDNKIFVLNAEIADNNELAEEAKKLLAETKTTTATALTELDTKKEDALSTIDERVSSSTSAALNEINTAGSTQADNINTIGITATDTITALKNDTVTSVIRLVESAQISERNAGNSANAAKTYQDNAANSATLTSTYVTTATSEANRAKSEADKVATVKDDVLKIKSDIETLGEQIETESATQLQIIQTEGATQTQRVQTEGNTQVQNVQDKYDEVSANLKVLTSDYDDITDTVILEGAIGGGIDATGITTDYVPTANGDNTWSWKAQQGGGSSVVVDNTLSVAGAAADSKTVGDNINTVKSDLILTKNKVDLLKPLSSDYDTTNNNLILSNGVDSDIVDDVSMLKNTLSHITQPSRNIYSLDKAYNKSYSGLTVKTDGDYIYVNGTSTSNASFVFDSIIELKGNQPYTLSGCPSGGGINSYRIDLRNELNDNLAYTTVMDYGEGVIFIPPTDNRVRLAIRIISGQTINIIFKPMLQFGDTTNLEFVPHITANDDVLKHEIEKSNLKIEMLENSIENLTDDSLNLLPIYDDIKIANGVTRTYSAENGTITLNGNCTATSSVTLKTKNNEDLEITLKANTIYTLSGCPDGGGSNTFWLDIRKKGSTSVWQTDIGNGVTFFVDEETVVVPNLRIVNGYAFNNKIFTPMLNIGKKIKFYPYSSKIANDKKARIEIDRQSNNTYATGGLVNSILKCGQTYIGKPLVYGNHTATHYWQEGSNQIDCSTLAVLAYMGVPYEASKYANNSNNQIVYPHGVNIIPDDNTTLSYQLAKYYYDKGIGFIPKVDGSDLLPGDLLFFAIPPADSGAFLSISHVEILISKNCSFSNPSSLLLTTLNASDGRSGESVVQVNNRLPSFWQNGRLAYAIHAPMLQIKTMNNYDYSNGGSYFVDDLILPIKQYNCVTITFTGILSKVGHFGLKINGTYREISADISTSMIGMPIDYVFTVGNSWSEALKFEIATSDTSAIIKDVKVIDGSIY